MLCIKIVIKNTEDRQYEETCRTIINAAVNIMSNLGMLFCTLASLTRCSVVSPTSLVYNTNKIPDLRGAIIFYPQRYLLHAYDACDKRTFPALNYEKEHIGLVKSSAINCAIILPWKVLGPRNDNWDCCCKDWRTTRLPRTVYHASTTASSRQLFIHEVPALAIGPHVSPSQWSR